MEVHVSGVRPLAALADRSPTRGLLPAAPGPRVPAACMPSTEPSAVFHPEVPACQPPQNATDSEPSRTL